MKKNRIAIAADHAGFHLKEQLIKYLKSVTYEIDDLGTYSDESVDYPDFGHKLALAVEGNKVDFGISLCGSGTGINITVNKHQGIRSAICWNVPIAKLAREHNDANICALPARFISFMDAKEIIDTFLNTGFDGGRHLRRVQKIPWNESEKPVSK